MRQFGIVASSVWRSKKFRALESDVARLTYFYLHTTTHGNSAGVFVLPPEMAALEMKVTGEAVRLAYAELNRVSLVNYDPAEELVQIVNFYRFNAITSRKHLAGPLRVIHSLPQSWVRSTAALELVLAIYERARGWDKTVEARGPFMQEAANLIRNFDLAGLITHPEHGLSIDLQIALSDDLLISLPIQGKGKDHGQYQDHGQYHGHDQDHGHDHRNGGKVDRAQADPQSGSSRPGRSVPEDIQATIAALGKSKGM